jgi:copper(I)-binding protein
VTRSMMRGATALAASAAVVAALLLTGCGAGQVTQTEGQQPPVSGVNVESADKKILMRNLAIAYPGPEGYARGESAPIHVRIINQHRNTVRLVAVTSDAGTVALGGPAAVPSTAAPAPATSSAAPSGSPSGSPSVSGSGSASGSPSAPASPTASPSPSGPAVNRQINVEIETRGIAVLDQGGERYLVITGLSEEFKPGQSIMMTFRFDNGVEIETNVPIEIPLSPPPRSPLHFDEEEHG